MLLSGGFLGSGLGFIGLSSKADGVFNVTEH